MEKKQIKLAVCRLLGHSISPKYPEGLQRCWTCFFRRDDIELVDIRIAGSDIKKGQMIYVKDIKWIKKK